MITTKTVAMCDKCGNSIDSTITCIEVFSRTKYGIKLEIVGSSNKEYHLCERCSDNFLNEMGRLND